MKNKCLKNGGQTFISSQKTKYHLLVVGYCGSGLNTMTHHYLSSLLFLLVPRIIIFGIKSRA